MEALAEDAMGQFDQLGLTAKYDPHTNNFNVSGDVPVRQVSEKRISNLDGGFDIFTGIIDGVTGEPLYGVRHYAVSGELYEGKFLHSKRHGDSAIVKNIHIPPPRETLPSEIEELACVQNPLTNLSFERANFFGTYSNDEPSHGTLVTDTFTYRGSFQYGRFHGLDGELIHSNGFRYKGEFQDGLFHGMGRELHPQFGEYQGEYRTGLKHGMGTFKEGQDAANAHDWDTDLLNDVCRSSDTDDSHEIDGDAATETENSTRTVREPPKRYTYSGYFHCNLRQGEGTEWTTNGQVYSGQFLSNRRHGHGSLKTMETTVTYEGQWRAGDPINGNGWRIVYPNEDV